MRHEPRKKYKSDRWGNDGSGGGPLIPAIVNAAQAAGAGLRDVHIEEPSLETLFLHHTGRSLRD